MSTSRIVANQLSMGNGVKDNVQVYNIPKFDGFHQRQQPPVLTENIAEIEAFSRVRFFESCISFIC